MQLPSAVQNLLTGIRNNDFVSLLILIGLVAGFLIAIAVIVNFRSARENKKKPPAEWGANSTRFKKSKEL